MYQRSLQSKWSQPAVRSRLASLRTTRLRGAYPQMAYAAPPPGMAYAPPMIAAAPDPISRQAALGAENADPAHVDELDYNAP
jgi:hypothetical protein